MHRRENYYSLSKEKPKSKFHFSIIILIVILTFAACFVLYMLSANGTFDKPPVTPLTDIPAQTTAEVTTAPVTEATTTVSVTTEPPVSTTPAANPVPPSEPLDMSYFDSCAFVGDSLSVGLSSYGFIPEKSVIADIGMNIDKINTATLPSPNPDVPGKTVLEALKERNPQNVYIMLGSNGIAWLSNEFMINEYSKFVDKVKAELPEAKIYILSIPPVAEGRETAASYAIQNSAIDAYNSELLKFANEKNLNFVDLNTELKGNDGKLPVEYAAKDGMHFNRNTYTIMLNYILNHIAED